MAGQPGFFDADERLRGLSASGDPLEPPPPSPGSRPGHDGRVSRWNRPSRPSRHPEAHGVQSPQQVALNSSQSSD
jgi:hypothetical protein